MCQFGQEIVGFEIVERDRQNLKRNRAPSFSDLKRESDSGLRAKAHLLQALKNIFKGAATTVIMRVQEDPLLAYYKRLTDGGTKPSLAKVALARKIAPMTLAIYKCKEAYNPERVMSQG